MTNVSILMEDADCRRSNRLVVAYEIGQENDQTGMDMGGGGGGGGG